MASYEIIGGEQFAAVARAFRAAEGELPVEIRNALDRAAPPLERAARESALANLPHRGGLNEIVAASSFTAQRRAGGIRIVARGISQLALTNQGRVRHPVFGHGFVGQSIPKARNWFYKPIEDGAGTVEKELLDAMDEIANRIA